MSREVGGCKLEAFKREAQEGGTHSNADQGCQKTGSNNSRSIEKKERFDKICEGGGREEGEMGTVVAVS